MHVQLQRKNRIERLGNKGVSLGKQTGIYRDGGVRFLTKKKLAEVGELEGQMKSYFRASRRSHSDDAVSSWRKQGTCDCSAPGYRDRLGVRLIYPKTVRSHD